MQIGAVARVGEGAKDARLFRRRLVKHGEGVVGMGGNDDLVEVFGGTIACVQAHAVWAPRNPGHARPGANGEAAILDEAVDIFPRPAAHRAPRGPVRDLQEPVIVEEADEGAGRVVQHLLGRR